VKTAQAPIKVNEQTKERIRYLAALIDTTQADVVDRAICEFTVRHADAIEKGISNARSALAGDNPDRASFLLDEPVESIQRVSGRSRTNLLSHSDVPH
jgi:predicted transcriptional regulator